MFFTESLMYFSQIEDLIKSSITKVDTHSQKHENFDSIFIYKYAKNLSSFIKFFCNSGNNKIKNSRLEKKLFYQRINSVKWKRISLLLLFFINGKLRFLENKNPSRNVFMANIGPKLLSLHLSFLINKRI